VMVVRKYRQKKEGEEKASEKRNPEFRSDMAAGRMVPDWDPREIGRMVLAGQSIWIDRDSGCVEAVGFHQGGREIAEWNSATWREFS
jgi:hypothetical protein